MLETSTGAGGASYIGGPYVRPPWLEPEIVKEYVRHGIDRFMLTYVGQQAGGQFREGGSPPARAPGRAGGARLAEDIRLQRRLPALPRRRARHLQPCPGKDRRVYDGLVRRGPRSGSSTWRVRKPSTASRPWRRGRCRRSSCGSRAGSPRQRAPATRTKPGDSREPLGACRPARVAVRRDLGEDKPCKILGFNVDINVSDLGCLATSAERAAGADATSAARALRRGAIVDRCVVRATHRMSILRSRKTGSRTSMDRGAASTPRPRPR